MAGESDTIEKANVALNSENSVPTVKQKSALVRKENEILFGGGRGSGMTEAGLMWLADPKYVNHPDYHALIICRKADILISWIQRAHEFFKPIGKITGNPAVITFPNGGIIRTGHLEDDNIFTKYSGHEYQKIAVDGLTYISDENEYEMFISSCRSIISELPAQVFATATPGHSGHAWVGKRWRIGKNNGKPFVVNPDSPLNAQKSRIFISATIDDIPGIDKKDPEYRKFLDDITDESLRKAWRHGNWDVK